MTSKNINHRNGCTRRYRRHTRHRGERSEMSQEAGHQDAGVNNASASGMDERFIRALYSDAVIEKIRKILKE